MSAERIEQVPLDRVRLDPEQPRQAVDEAELGLLRASMSELGRTVQYITVAPEADGSWRLLSGERRVRAAQSLGWAWLPAVVVDDPTDAPTRFVRQVAENAARSPLRPWELCQAIDRMRGMAGPSEIAAATGISVRTVHNYLTVLEHPHLVEALRGGKSLRSVLAAATDTGADTGAAGPSPQRSLRAARRATTTLVSTWDQLAPSERAALLAVLRPLLGDPASADPPEAVAGGR